LIVFIEKHMNNFIPELKGQKMQSFKIIEI